MNISTRFQILLRTRLVEYILVLILQSSWFFIPLTSFNFTEACLYKEYHSSSQIYSKGHLNCWKFREKRNAVLRAKKSRKMKSSLCPLLIIDHFSTNYRSLHLISNFPARKAVVLEFFSDCSDICWAMFFFRQFQTLTLYPTFQILK